MSKLKQLAGETVLYGIGSILPRMLNFLLVPLHTIDVFTRAEYGTVTELYAYVAFVNIVFMFGMETAFFRFASNPSSNTKRIFNLAHTSVLLISVPLSVLFILFSSPIASSLGVAQHPEFITWLTLVMLTDAAVAIPFAKLRLEKKALQFASAKIISVLILLILNYYFLKIKYDPTINVGYVFLANLIANSFFILFFLRTLLSWRPSYDKEITPVMLRYAYPVMLTGVAGMTNEMFSRLTLEWWLPDNFYTGLSKKDALGVFGACYKFAVLMNLGIQAFRYAAEPFFFSNAIGKNSPLLFAKINHYFIITCCIVLLGISINLDILKHLIGEDFWVGLSIVPILLVAYLFLGVYYNFSVWFKLTDKTYFGTWITVGGAIITVVANFLLIPIFGYMGSAWAALACYLSMTVACYAIGQKFYPVPYKFIPSLVYLFSAIALIYSINRIEFTDQILATALHILFIAVFIGVAYLVERKNLSQEK
ncbi:MAG: polysaccharide biosynthesis C-terminal domain-containing protein [Bacteroidia bacterium]|nr:polysaccharide biosynthesis C-terminal domain-containing protein [Bacteroidia bacterium]